MYQVTHGDHGTSASDKIVQKTKNVVNSRFFLRIFFPAHLDHWFHSEKFSGGWRVRVYAKLVRVYGGW